MIGTFHLVDLHRPACIGVRLFIFAAEDGGCPRHAFYHHVAPHKVHLDRWPHLPVRSAPDPVIQQAAVDDVVQRTARVGFVDQAQIRRSHFRLDKLEDRGVTVVVQDDSVSIYQKGRLALEVKQSLASETLYAYCHLNPISTYNFRKSAP